MNMQLKQTFQTPDGSNFDTKEAALRHMRKGAIMAALLAVAGGDRPLAAALYDKEDELNAAFDTGTVRMVTKAERKSLDKALDALVAAKAPGTEFLVTNVEAVKQSFRWPAQKRLTPEEKVAAQLTAVVDIFDGREDVAGWVVQEKDKIMAAFKAGQPERKVSDKASEGLALWRAMKDAEKAHKAALEVHEKEPTEETAAAVEAARVAFDEAKKTLDERKAANAAAADAAK